MEEKKDLRTKAEQEKDKGMAESEPGVAGLSVSYPHNDRLRQLCLDDVNNRIATYKVGNNIDTNLISDGYHTFGELYEHRNQLFIALCRLLDDINSFEQLPVWRSKCHSDGSGIEGWFLLGMGLGKGQQITYHLPISKWDECSFAHTFVRAPEFDGHTSADVLEKLKNL